MFQIRLTLDEALGRRLDPAFVAGGETALKPLRGRIVALLERAAAEALAPDLDRGRRLAGRRVAVLVTLPDAVAVELITRHAARGVPRAVLIRGLLHAALDREADSTDAAAAIDFPGRAAFERFLGRAGLRPRPEQLLVVRALLDALDSGRIGLVEAATGVGKTLAVLGAATVLLEKGAASRVVVAVPTLAVLGQYLAQMPPGGPQIAAVLGRQEFLDPELVAEAAEQDPSLAGFVGAIERWLGRQGRTVRGPARQRWLAAALLEEAPDFPVEDFQLGARTPEDNPAQREYRAQFEACREAAIVICTHVMLAVHSRHHLRARADDARAVDARARLRRGDTQARAAREVLAALDAELAQDGFGRLPPFSHLVVDEAHLLESQFALALSGFVALRAHARRLVEAARAGWGLGRARAERVQAAVEQLMALARAADVDNVPLHDRDARCHVASQAVFAEAFSELADALRGRFRKPAGARERRRADALDAERALVLAAADPTNPLVARLEFSPVRRHPRVVLGQRSVKRNLETIWNAATGGAACLSATLYLPRGRGGASAAAVRIQLALDRHTPPGRRVREYPPIEPQWLREPVRIYVNDGEQLDLLRLRPPTRGDRLSADERDEAIERWHSAVADYLYRHIVPTAAGGVLCLLTSYATAEALYRLAPASERGSIVTPFLAGETSPIPVIAQRTVFLERMRSHGKAIWLAVGAAWTGLDVGGHAPWAKRWPDEGELPAGEDNVLTDLVIPRLPFGFDDALCAEWRRRRYANMPWELYAMLFYLKQGIGRLVRRAGVPANRRIWLLDYRIADGSIGSMVAPVLELLRRYRRGDAADANPQVSGVEHA